MLGNNVINRSDRGFARTMSSTQHSVAFTALAAALAAVAMPACAQPVSPPSTPPVQQAILPPAATVQPLPAPRPTDPLSNAVYEWKLIQQSESLSFSTYAAFMIAHPGWPGEATTRKNAERSLRPDGENPRLVADFFGRFAPQSAASFLRYAEALSSLGRQSEALAAARQAWIGGVLTPEDESRVLSRFSGAIQAGDNDVRMDRLLWSRATTPAMRQLVLVSPAKRDIFNARLGFLTKAADAALRDSLVPTSARSDAGFVADRVFWLRGTGQKDTALAYLAQPMTLAAPPLDASKWLDMLEGTARDATAAYNSKAALAIARKVELAYGPGTMVRDRSFAERDAYTDITWLGGMAALEKLAQPLDAVRMFELYGNAAKSPQTRAKGFYWAGRAAEQAGRKDLSTLYYTQAAEYFDQFHGQLAHERLGRPIALPLTTGKIEVSGAERNAFEKSEVVRAAVLLGQQGNWQDQTRFVRSIAANVQGAVNHALAAELAVRINRPDLGLLVGKSAREDGLPDYLRPSFPMMAVPPDHQASWTMIHAITRQESQFDREAMSRVGARGLMQLMPGTAKQTAPSAGVSYSLAALTQNPQDNIRLGSTYFGQLMTQYGGSYILAVAAYNAGPGNVNKWIKANGDPRLPGVDTVKWIESIPISETRGYVQRVLENAVVYDLLNPRRQGRPGTRISAFLGGYPSGYGSP